MPHVNAYIRDEQYHIFLALKTAGIWPMFLHDCLALYEERYLKENKNESEQKEKTEWNQKPSDQSPWDM